VDSAIDRQSASPLTFRFHRELFIQLTAPHPIFVAPYRPQLFDDHFFASFLSKVKLEW
jgi:hypothetical protein